MSDPLDWNAVVKWAGIEIDQKVSALCSSELAQDHVNLLRGEVKALKRLLDLPKRRLEDAKRAAAFGHQG